ncbi:MAG: hypothetical protein ACWGPR_05585 [Candidatus Deferrimicrobiaceae bacterium]
MSPRTKGVRACLALALFLIAIGLLSACGRKAKPEPRWGRTASWQVHPRTR